MSIDNRRGMDGASEALLFTLSAGLPSKITTHNASRRVTAGARLAGPYVVPTGGRTLILTLDGGAEWTGTVAASTYTAATLVTAVTALTGFTAAGFTAATQLDGNRFVIRKTTAGVAGDILIGAGAINAILGFNGGEKFAGYPLAAITYWRVQDLADPVPAAPACIVTPPAFTADDEMMGYRSTIRLMTQSIAYTAGSSADALAQAMALADLARDLLEDSTSLYTSADGHEVVSGAHSVGWANEEMSAIHGAVDLAFEWYVQEE